jgi:1-aminocyclopropane-1-carboxylate deaminase
MNLKNAFNIRDIPVEHIQDAVFNDAGCRLSVLRTDLVHPDISGNKWFKLKHNLIRARQEGHKTLLSFGGAWSNHLHALAFAGKTFGFNTVGIVRGGVPEPLNPCLRDAAEAGMRLIGISRLDYRKKEDPALLNTLRERLGDFYLIPEGGANREGALGCAEILHLVNQEEVDLIAMACGTGTMLTGLASNACKPLLGIQVLKGEGYLERQIQDNFLRFGMEAACTWSINDQLHDGGYARASPALLSFINKFEADTGIPLDPVYTGKLLNALYILKKRDFFPQKCRILAIHSGGIQGRRGFV